MKLGNWRQIQRVGGAISGGFPDPKPEISWNGVASAWSLQIGQMNQCFLQGWVFMVFLCFLHIPWPMWKTWIPLKHVFHHAEKITLLSISDFICAWILCILNSPGSPAFSMGKSEPDKIHGQNMSEYHQNTPGAFCLMAPHLLTHAELSPQSPSRLQKLDLNIFGTTPCEGVFQPEFFIQAWNDAPQLGDEMMRKSHLAWFLSPISVVLFNTCYCFLVSSKSAQHKQALSQIYRNMIIWAVSELPTDR